MTEPRNRLVSPETTPYYHCICRCVRRAFLCGEDFASGRSCEHRKRWVTDRLRELSQAFAIELSAYAVMSNHYHVVVRLDVEAAASWDEREVCRRWALIFGIPQAVDIYLKEGGLDAETEAAVKARIELWRERLSSLSWYMRCLNETIARRANREDRCTGRFWEGRFTSQALLGAAALTACMAYVDLNPIRAGIAKTPEASYHTSVRQRIRELQGRRDKRLPPLLTHPTPRTDSPLPLSLEDYLALVDATGRKLKAGKRGATPAELPPILQRLGLETEGWLQLAATRTLRIRAIGQLEALKDLATDLRQKFLRGQYALAKLFPT